MPRHFQGHLRDGISGHKSRVTEMVFGDITDCECEKEFVQLSTGARLRFEPKDSMVHNGSYSRGDGKERGALLEGIIEADETYIGGKPRKPNKREDDEPSKRGRGTEKTAIIGAIQRGGKVVAQVAEQLTGRSILKFIRSVANLKESELITDEYQAYKLIGKEMKHTVINHNERFTDGNTHTNTIEGFWSLLKRAWFGSHHHYETGYTPLYVAEICYKYNYRNRDIFSKFINESMLVH